MDLTGSQRSWVDGKLEDMLALGMMRNPARLLKRIWFRAAPFPLFSGYLLPVGKNRTDRFRCFHRRLALYRIRRLATNPLFLLLSMLQGIIWYFVRFWVVAGRLAVTKGNVTVNGRRVPRGRQLKDMFRLNFLYHIHPRSYFLYRYYDPDERSRMHERVYRGDLPGFHDLSNRSSKEAVAYKGLLADKFQFSRKLEAAGFPAIKTISRVTSCKDTDINNYFHKRDVFCKPNHGSQGRDAFSIRYYSNSGTYTLFPLSGSPLIDNKKIIRYLRRIGRSGQEMLVEERLTDHPAVASLSGADEVTTLRIITGKLQDGSVVPLYTQIEIPRTDTDGSRKKGYMVYPLDMPSCDPVKKWIAGEQASYNFELHMSADVKALIQEAVEICIRAHAECIKLKSVAFDAAITPTGPVIIEANYNWNIELMFRAPTLLDEKTKAKMWLDEIISEGRD